MAAATITNTVETEMWPFQVYSFDLSVMTSDQLENIAYGTAGPFHFKPQVSHEIITPPVGHDPVSVYHEEASDDVTTNKTVAIRVCCANIASCVIRVRFMWFASKGGGIRP